MMNSPFLVEQAKALAKRPELASAQDYSVRIRQVYRLLFGRAPASEELAYGLHSLQGAEQIRPAQAGQTGLTPVGRVLPGSAYDE